MNVIMSSLLRPLLPVLKNFISLYSKTSKFGFRSLLETACFPLIDNIEFFDI